MEDEFQKLFYETLPQIKDDQFARLCYEIFITNQSGKTLLMHLYNNYVYKTDKEIFNTQKVYDPNIVIGQMAKKDLIQSLLLRAQLYQESLKRKPGE